MEVTKMSAVERGEPLTRRERLAAIAEEYTERIHEPRTAAQLAGRESVSCLAAITSEGSIESGRASNGNLIVADTPGELAERLRQEAGEGWLAHGRAWDLDLPWHSWGTLSVSVAIGIGEESTRAVGVVVVEGRADGIYLFDDLLDAKAFQEVVRRTGGEAALSEEPLHDHRAAGRLIDAERGR
jgi:hypothetical protein